MGQVRVTALDLGKDIQGPRTWGRSSERTAIIIWAIHVPMLFNYVSTHVTCCAAAHKHPGLAQTGVKYVAVLLNTRTVLVLGPLTSTIHSGRKVPNCVMSSRKGFGVLHRTVAVPALNSSPRPEVLLAAIAAVNLRAFQKLHVVSMTNGAVGSTRSYLSLLAIRFDASLGER